MENVKASLRSKLSDVKLLMVSSDLWAEIDVRLSEIFSASIGFLFVGISVVVIGNYLIFNIY